MTQPPHSLLVLAWDDADPGAHPAAAPPTLPVLRQLAAHQPLLAVLPELPAEVQTTEYQTAVAAQQADETNESAAVGAAETDTPAATEAGPVFHPEPGTALGTVLLPLTATDAGVTASRIVGLADLGDVPPAPAAIISSPEIETGEPLAAPVTVAATTSLAPVFSDSLAQSNLIAKFIHTTPRPIEPWAAPAAPYLGSSPPPSPPATVGSAEAAELQATAITKIAATTSEAAAIEGASATLTDAGLARNPGFVVANTLPVATPVATPAAPAMGREAEETALSFDEVPADITSSAPEFTADTFAQAPAEVGPEEAADLYAPEDNLTLAPEEADSSLMARPLPDAPERASLSQALHALHRTAPEPEPASAIDLAAADLIEPEPLPATVAPPVPLSDNLHYRIIQYARFATHVADEQQEEFAAIYAPNWPTWLAALEIRYRSRRPLVLHLTELAAATAAPAERGWRLELERYAIRRAHTILVATDALRRQLLRHYGHPPGRLRVIAADDEAGINAILAKVGTVADF